VETPQRWSNAPYLGPADYALWINNQIIGIVEAKKLTVGPQSVLEPADAC
jgi:type I site-specific restriction endonuclease